MRKATSPVQTAFDRLLAVRELTFGAGSQAPAATGWVGCGRGDPGGWCRWSGRPADVLVFLERGTWTPAVGRPTTFHNLYRWTRTGGDARLHLAHLRFGPDRPVELFDLVPAGPARLTSADPHARREDRYAAELTWDADTIHMTWTVAGTAKAERIAYVYR